MAGELFSVGLVNISHLLLNLACWNKCQSASIQIHCGGVNFLMIWFSNRCICFLGCFNISTHWWWDIPADYERDRTERMKIFWSSLLGHFSPNNFFSSQICKTFLKYGGFSRLRSYQIFNYSYHYCRCELQFNRLTILFFFFWTISIFASIFLEILWKNSSHL